jgi:hypothetical protein
MESSAPNTCTAGVASPGPNRPGRNSGLSGAAAAAAPDGKEAGGTGGD